MNTAGEAATRCLHRALAEEVHAVQETHAEDVSREVCQERSREVDAKVATFQEEVERIEEALAAARENLATKQRYILALEQEVKAMEEKERAVEEEFRVVLRNSSDEAHTSVDRALKKRYRNIMRLAHKVEIRHGIPPLKKELERLTKERDARKKPVKAIDKEIEKLRKAARSTKDDNNAFVVQIATLAVENATTKQQVQKMREEMKALELEKTQVQSKARAKAKVAKNVMSSRPVPMSESAQSMPSLVPADRQASLQFASSTSPNTAQQSLAIRPVMQDRSLPVGNTNPSLSPLLMPPPSLKSTKSTIRPVRPAIRTTQPAPSMYLGDLGSLLDAASSHQLPERDPATPGTSTSSHSSPEVPRKIPRIELSAAPKMPFRCHPSRADERAEPLPPTRVTLVPNYQRILHTATQNPAAHPYTSAGPASALRKTASAAVPRDKGPIPIQSAALGQQRQPRVRFHCPDRNEVPASEPMSGQASTCEDAESLASQSLTASSAHNSPGVQFLEREEAAGPLEALAEEGSPAQSESSINASDDTAYNLFGDDDDSGGDSFFFNLNCAGSSGPKLTF